MESQLPELRPTRIIISTTTAPQQSPSPTFAEQWYHHQANGCIIRFASVVGLAMAHVSSIERSTMKNMAWPLT